MALKQIQLLEDPENKILPGYYEVNDCTIRIFSMALFGLINASVAVISCPRPETGAQVMSEWYKNPPKRVRQISDFEIREIIEDLTAFVALFGKSERESADMLILSILKVKKSNSGVPGGLPTQGPFDDPEVTYEEDQMDSREP